MGVLYINDMSFVPPVGLY